MARPRIVIDKELVRKLAEIQCTWPEMENITGISQRTLQRRCGKIIEAARDNGKMSLRRKRFEVAMGGSVPMLIWLSKQMLGESDRVEGRNPDIRENTEVTGKAVYELKARLETLIRAKEEMHGLGRGSYEAQESQAPPHGLLPS